MPKEIVVIMDHTFTRSVIDIHTELDKYEEENPNRKWEVRSVNRTFIMEGKNLVDTGWCIAEIVED